MSGNGDLAGTGQHTFTCEKCGVAFSGIIPYRDHLKSKKHKQKISSTLLQASLDDSGNLNITSDEDETQKVSKDNQFKCEECDKNFSGPIPYMQHVKGNSHRRMLRNKILSETAADLASSIRDKMKIASRSELSKSLEKKKKDETDNGEAGNESKELEIMENHFEPSAPFAVKNELLAGASDEPKFSFTKDELKCQLCADQEFVSLHDMMLHYESDVHRAKRIEKQLSHIAQLTRERRRSNSSTSSIENIDTPVEG